MFIAGYIIGGFLSIVPLVVAFFGSALDPTYQSSPESNLGWSLWFIGGVIIILISRIGQVVSGHIREIEQQQIDEDEWQG